MTQYFAGFLTCLMLTVTGIIIFLVKIKPVKDALAEVRAKLKIMEIKNDIKKSANKTLTESQSDDMHSRSKGTRLN